MPLPAPPPLLAPISAPRPPGLRNCPPARSGAIRGRPPARRGHSLPGIEDGAAHGLSRQHGRIGAPGRPSLPLASLFAGAGRPEGKRDSGQVQPGGHVGERSGLQDGHRDHQRGRPVLGLLPDRRLRCHRRHHPGVASARQAAPHQPARPAHLRLHRQLVLLRLHHRLRGAVLRGREGRGDPGDDVAAAAGGGDARRRLEGQPGWQERLCTCQIKRNQDPDLLLLLMHRTS